MKHIFTTLKFVTISAIAMSCVGNSEESHSHENHNHEAEEAPKTEQEISHEGDGTLVLDNGKPWLANAETTEGVVKMVALMDAFSDFENPEAYASLQASLEAEFESIFKQCTMTGEAHNQLHNFLLPLKGYMRGLEKEDNQLKMKNFVDLKNHLNEYPKYFKTEE